MIDDVCILLTATGLTAEYGRFAVASMLTSLRQVADGMCAQVNSTFKPRLYGERNSSLLSVGCVVKASYG